MGTSRDDPNPCISCGACCAYFRIYFYWREAELESDIRVPIQLTTDVNPFQRCMLGTTEKSGNRCVALEGRVGQRVSCSIYANRPTPCRAFPASYSDGKPNKRCTEAREAHGLKPLTREYWSPPLSSETPSQSTSDEPHLLPEHNPT